MTATAVFALLSQRIDSEARGITSISKTGTQDNVDTYTITYTDGTSDTFTVTNGMEVLITDPDTVLSFYINDDGELVYQIGEE